jgi:Uma2 family endonuclease
MTSGRAIAPGGAMMRPRRWTVADVDRLPDDETKRLEIIDGQLFISDPTHWYHQRVCLELTVPLGLWSHQTDAGVAVMAPGIIFADDEAVAPDIVWISHERLATALEPDGKLHAAPELIAEVLSLGLSDEWRDREIKLKLYSRRGVREYWIVDWQQRRIEVFRRDDTALQLTATLLEGDTLDSPLLPCFALPLSELFAYALYP